MGMKATCDGRLGAHGQPSTNSTCDDSCYDFCWRQDVGDCADDDDVQAFCVGQCMFFCVNENCRDRPMPWTRCQQHCNAEHMHRSNPNFIDYSNCMAKCTPVPVSPYGGA